MHAFTTVGTAAAKVRIKSKSKYDRKTDFASFISLLRKQLIFNEIT